MIGKKVDVITYQSEGIKKIKNQFSFDEIILSHYDTLQKDSRKIAKIFFKDNIYPLNGFKRLNIEDAIQRYLFELRANVPFPGPRWGEEKFTFIDLFAGIG